MKPDSSREITIQLAVKSVSTFAGNACPACREIAVQLGVKYARFFSESRLGIPVSDPVRAHLHSNL